MTAREVKKRIERNIKEAAESVPLPELKEVIMNTISQLEKLIEGLKG